MNLPANGADFWMDIHIYIYVYMEHSQNRTLTVYIYILCMYIYMCICIYMYIYIHIYIYTYIIYTYIYTYMYISHEKSMIINASPRSKQWYWETKPLQILETSSLGKLWMNGGVYPMVKICAGNPSGTSRPSNWGKAGLKQWNVWPTWGFP